MKVSKVVIIIAALSICVCEASAQLAPNLGAASQYAIVGLENATVLFDKTGSSVVGNVAIASGGKLDFWKGTINGDLYLDSNASVLRFTGLLNGDQFTGQNLSQVVADALAAKNAAMALSATQTISSITNSLTINGNGGLNVINVGSLNLANNKVLTLSGSANDVFVLNVSSLLQTGNNSKISLSGVNASKVLINVLGNTGIVNGSVNGTILAYGKNINLQGTLNGAVIAGTVTIGDADVTISSTINGIAFVPEPATLVILGLGTALMIGRRRNILR